MSGKGLPAAPLRVVNVGLEIFAEELEAQGAEVVQVDWRPPAGGNPRMAALLSRLEALDRDPS